MGLVIALLILRSEFLATLETTEVMRVVVSSTGLKKISIDFSLANCTERFAKCTVAFVAMQAGRIVFVLRVVGSLSLQRLLADNTRKVI